jgi:hypothetical protein
MYICLFLTKWFTVLKNTTLDEIKELWEVNRTMAAA